MKQKFTFFIIFSIAFVTFGYAQYSSCIVTVATIINGQNINLKSTEGVLTFSSKSGELILSVDVNSFTTSSDSINSILYLQEDQLLFKGSISPNITSLINNEENTGRSFPVDGVVNYKTYSILSSAQYNIFKANNERDDLMKNIKMSIFITLSASNAKIIKLIPKLTDDIIIQVNEGTTNIIE